MRKTLTFTLALLLISLVSFGQTISGIASQAAPLNSGKAITAVLTYADDAVETELGTGGTFTTNALAYFPASDFTANIGEDLFMMSVAVGASSSITSFELCIWTDTSGHGANPIMTQTVTNLVDGWNQIILNSPYTLGTTPIFIGYKMSTSGYSIGCDAAAHSSGNGDMLQDPTSGAITALGSIGFGDISVKGHIGSLEPIEAQLYSIDNDLIVTASATEDIKGTIKNNGTSDITTYDVVYSINGGTPVAAYTVTPSSPITFSSMHSFTHNVPADLSAGGNFTIEVTISNINGGNDANTTDNTLSKDLLTANELYTKNVVYEEATGTWCGWCVRGLVGLNTMAHDVTNGTWIGIGVHNADPMVVTAYDNAIGNFIGGYPSGIMDRHSGAVDPGLPSLQSAFNMHKVMPAIAKVEVTNKSFDATSRAWSLDVVSTFGMDLTSADYNTALIIVENNVTGTSSGYAQANYYSGGGSGDMIDYDGRNYANLTNPVPAADMSYNHVGRVLVDGFDGSANSIPSTITYNTANSFSYSGTLPANIEPWRASFVAIIIDNATGHIINATEVVLGNVSINNATESKYSIYPNPTNGIVTVEGTKDAQINVYNMIGEIIYSNDKSNENTTIDLSSFAAGNYIVKIISNDEVTTQKIILTK